MRSLDWDPSTIAGELPSILCAITRAGESRPKSPAMLDRVALNLIRRLVFQEHRPHHHLVALAHLVVVDVKLEIPGRVALAAA